MKNKKKNGYLYLEAMVSVFVVTIGFIFLYDLMGTGLLQLRKMYTYDRALQHSVTLMEAGKNNFQLKKEPLVGEEVIENIRYTTQLEEAVVRGVTVNNYVVQAYDEKQKILEYSTYLY